jgi:hypothetical protein
MVNHNFPNIKLLFHWRDTPCPDTAIFGEVVKALNTKSRVAKSTQSAGSCSYRKMLQLKMVIYHEDRGYAQEIIWVMWVSWVSNKKKWIYRFTLEEDNQHNNRQL